MRDGSMKEIAAMTDDSGTAQGQTIALVDDDRNILTSVTVALEAEGFRVRSYPDGEKALKALTQKPADLALLDIKMPRMDGIELLRRLREITSMPVIFLTSKQDEIDELLGLKMGADDYVAKPFSQRLVIERIRTVLKRTAVPQSAEARGDSGSREEEVMVRGNLNLDPARHQILWKGQDVPLTVTEFIIVQALANRPGHVKSRDQLMDIAYSDDIYVDDRTIDSHIKRVRRKFREADPDFSAIETLYGVGYRFKEG